MKRVLITLIISMFASFAMADSIFYDSFEYANHDGVSPIGWNCDDQSWVCGYQEKDHNRIAHDGNWYVHTNADESWMYMQNYMSTELRYRYSFWAISDGSYQVEIWAGNAPEVAQMTHLLYATSVNSGTYEKVSVYIESLPANYQYFGIHAVGGAGAYYLTIDEFNIDMINKYDLEVTPNSMDTVMMPGETLTFNYKVQNTGYEDLHIYMTPITDYFNSISFTENGFPYASFPTVANQIVEASCTATLNPGLAIGQRVWMDIMFTVSCDCVTRMATIWVTIGDTTELSEGIDGGEQVQRVEVFDLTGKRVDPSHLRAGIYLERTTTSSGVTTRKLIKP